MKRHAPWLAVAVVGCGLVNSNTLSYEYAFDPPQGFMEKLGDDKAMQTVPMQACDPTAATDQCAQLQAALPAGSMAKLSCDATTRMCAAVVDVVLPYMVNLSMQNLPAPVVQYGADHVGIEKVAYWIMTNTVNVDLPPMDLYVASGGVAATDYAKSGTLIGTVAKLPARSAACADSADSKGDSASMGAAVCDISLSDAGQTALAGFVKDYKTPFQFIAHAKIVAHGGDPLPTGTIAFFVRPTVAFYVLK